MISQKVSWMCSNLCNSPNQVKWLRCFIRRCHLRTTQSTADLKISNTVASTRTKKLTEFLTSHPPVTSCLNNSRQIRQKSTRVKATNLCILMLTNWKRYRCRTLRSSAQSIPSKTLPMRLKKRRSRSASHAIQQIWSPCRLVLKSCEKVSTGLAPRSNQPLKFKRKVLESQVRVQLTSSTRIKAAPLIYNILRWIIYSIWLRASSCNQGSHHHSSWLPKSTMSTCQTQLRTLPIRNSKLPRPVKYNIFSN